MVDNNVQFLTRNLSPLFRAWCFQPFYCWNKANNTKFTTNLSVQAVITNHQYYLWEIPANVNNYFKLFATHCFKKIQGVCPSRSRRCSPSPSTTSCPRSRCPSSTICRLWCCPCPFIQTLYRFLS